jgi:hypothetical protein
MAEQPIPFAEGAPSDNLKVEQIGNNEVLIGDPELDIKQDIDTEFDANLAEDINDKELKRKAADLIRIHDEDREARSDWEERYKAGLRTVDPDGGMSEEEDARASRGLSTVVHPMIAEAATQFNARAIAELYPSGGPVKTVIVGEAAEESEDQARRVKDFMNYQITQEMPEYFPDLDKMLFQLPLVGHAFKKVWWDANLERQCSRFVKAEDFVVAPESTDLYTSQRYTHVIRMARNDFNKYVEAGWYLESEYAGDGIDPSGDTTEDIEGIDPYSPSDETMTLLEMHVYESFDGVDGYDDSDDDNVVGLPYVITIDPDSEKVVSVRRNWDPEDPKMKRLDWFVSYPFLPGVGFYGFGLYHLIGGLGKAATGSLRALLDSAAFANMQGGFKLKGRVTGGELQINPGEFADLDATVDDVNKAIMPLPFKEPSGALFNLLGFITDAGKRFANTSDMNVGDVNPNAPVGTTVALIEQGSKSFSAIHKRLHYAQGQEFKLLAKLNAKYLPDNMEFALAGASQVIYAKDFDERIDVIPVSDPNIFSTAQRIAQAQSIMSMANAAPQLHDIYEAYKRMYEAIRIPNIDEVLKKPQEAVRLDPIDENMSLMYGKPIRAFPEQDHDAHIAVHIQFMQDPSLAGNPASKGMQPLLIAHIAEHVALLYRQRMQASIGVDLPTIPNLKDPRFSFDDISPEMDMIISQKAAQVVAESPQMEAIKPIAAMAKQNPLQYAQQLAKLEMDSLQARTQQQLAADKAKAENQMAITAAKARQDLEIEAAKTRADLEAKIAKLEADLRLEREKVLQKEIIKGGS